MATVDNPPEGGFPVPATYPNPLANNVNMKPIPWSVAVAQNAPIGINGANGSRFGAS